MDGVIWEAAKNYHKIIAITIIDCWISQPLPTHLMDQVLPMITLHLFQRIKYLAIWLNNRRVMLFSWQQSNRFLEARLQGFSKL